LAKKRAASAAGGGALLPATGSERNVMPLNGRANRATTRTTLVLPEVLDQNLELFAVKAGIPKGEIIKQLLTDFLTKQGFQPDKRPRSIDVIY